MTFIDGHDDVLSRPWRTCGDPVEGLGSRLGHVKVKACLAGIAHMLPEAAHLEIVTDASSLSSTFDGRNIACLLHPKGAEASDADLLAHMGKEKVALASDFNGARTPHGIGSAADRPRPADATGKAGYAEDLEERNCHRNRLELMTSHLKDAA